MTYKKGFTLIEILVVIAIIGVLSAVGLASYRSANEKARDSRRQADVQQLRSALEMYKTDKDVYPDDLNALTTDYLSGQSITDPKTKEPYAYVPNASGGYTITYKLESEEEPREIKNP